MALLCVHPVPTTTQDCHAPSTKRRASRPIKNATARSCTTAGPTCTYPIALRSSWRSCQLVVKAVRPTYGRTARIRRFRGGRRGRWGYGSRIDIIRGILREVDGSVDPGLARRDVCDRFAGLPLPLSRIDTTSVVIWTYTSVQFENVFQGPNGIDRRDRELRMTTARGCYSPSGGRHRSTAVARRSGLPNYIGQARHGFQ